MIDLTQVIEVALAVSAMVAIFALVVYAGTRRL
jgi:hypothetical protein